MQVGGRVCLGHKGTQCGGQHPPSGAAWSSYLFLYWLLHQQVPCMSLEGDQYFCQQYLCCTQTLLVGHINHDGFFKEGRVCGGTSDE